MPSDDGPAARSSRSASALQANRDESAIAGGWPRDRTDGGPPGGLPKSPRSRDPRSPTSAGLSHSPFRSGDAGRLSPSPPSHPGLPARVSVLMLPARGLVSRLLAPCETSAVFAGSGTVKVPALRPDSGAGERRRSVMASSLRDHESYA